MPRPVSLPNYLHRLANNRDKMKNHCSLTMADHDQIMYVESLYRCRTHTLYIHEIRATIVRGSLGNCLRDKAIWFKTLGQFPI